MPGSNNYWNEDELDTGREGRIERSKRGEADGPVPVEWSVSERRLLVMRRLNAVGFVTSFIMFVAFFPWTHQVFVALLFISFGLNMALLGWRTILEPQPSHTPAPVWRWALMAPWEVPQRGPFGPRTLRATRQIGRLFIVGGCFFSAVGVLWLAAQLLTRTS